MKTSRLSLILLGFLGFSGTIPTYALDSLRTAALVQQMLETGLRESRAYTMLQELTEKAPHRLSGSAGEAKAVSVMQELMRNVGAVNVRAESLMVPRWVRGAVEECIILPSAKRGAIRLSVCALGGSVATPKGGITAEILEVKSFDELHALGQVAAGKIIFFNRPMDPSLLNTFSAYGGAVDQRSRGAIEGAKAGAVAVIVRSVTLAMDDVPHTGAMGYETGIATIPAAAISTMGAERLCALLRIEKRARLRLKLSCKTLPDVPSANVVGEIVGTEKPEEIIVVGGHLDSWDKGTGAHDDGAGCVQAVEVLRLFRELGIKPRRTIRAVMFMNEENGTRGGKAYADNPLRNTEKAYAAIESDRGGFAPRGLTIQGDSVLMAKVAPWKPFFEQLDAGKFIGGHGGVDISPICGKGAAGFGLLVESHRYFDYHHSDNDTIDKVNPREVEMGAIVETLLCYLLSEEGL